MMEDRNEGGAGDRAVSEPGSGDLSGPSVSEAGAPPSEPPVRVSRVRWRPAVFIVAAAVMGQAIGLMWAGDDLSKRSLVTAIPWMLAAVFLLVWWVLLSGVRWSTRLRGLLIPAAALGVFAVLFRWDGQAGNFVPQFRFRFAPSAEERAVEYFRRQRTSSARLAEEAPFVVTPEDWPRFGGADRTHVVSGPPIRRDWDVHPPTVLWRHPIGPGWSSFAVVGHRLFTQEQRGPDEAVVCYHADTGEQLWIHTDPVRFSEPASGAGPRATPTVHGTCVYALGATGILNCLDAVSGERVWSADIIKDAETELVEWGMAGSPLIQDDVVIVNPGGSVGAVAAYDLRTGEKRWAGAGHRAGYASPLPATLDGVEQILIFCSTGLCGHDARTGQLLWSFPWTNMTNLNIAQPIVLPDQTVFISSGYGGGSARLKIARRDGTWRVDPVWTARDRFRLKFNGGIYRDGYVYGLDEGILACFDVERGRKTWKRGRYRFGQIVMVGDDLLVSAEDGRVVLVEVSPKKATEIASFQAIEGKTWNHPVVNRGRLYIRNAEEAACYDLSVQ